MYVCMYVCMYVTAIHCFLYFYFTLHGFPGVQHSSLSISLVILVVSVMRYRAEKQTDTQTNGGKHTPPATSVGVRNKSAATG